jgi:hypothetical protein
MRAIPVDITRITFIGTGKAAEKAEYVELSDGQRRRSGNQQKNDAGVPVWTVDVIVDDDEAMRAEAIGVTVASYDPPVTKKWAPVVFRNLTAVIYRDNATGQPKVSLKADGIENTAAKPSAA